MQFTDLFIKRPVLATVVSLVIFLLGARAAMDLNVRQYPRLQNAQVNTLVAYPGADAALMEGYVTTLLEREIATADGIDLLYSNTQSGTSVISAFLRGDKDPNEALTEIQAKVNKVRSRLPEGAEDPVIEIADAEQTRPMYLSFWSDTLDDSQVSDLLARIVEPELSALPGVERAEFFGARVLAIRVWLKPDRLTAHDLTASEVYASLQRQNFLSAVGQTNGAYVKIALSAKTELRTPEEFRNLVVKSDGDKVVRLGDVATVSLGAENYETAAFWNAKPAVFVGIKVRPEANVLDAIGAVREAWPGLIARFPPGMYGTISYDSTDYIRSAIDEVKVTLVEAVLIVVVVIYLFLGSMRSALIPAVTVPLSLVGAMFLMYALGFSINLLTLLAMVLAIGMVVDDAIIVLENVHRHVEEGMKPMAAAIQGARELIGPVIAMTITLVAVYAPIGFLSGITGTLFTEFAFTLAGAVLISGVVALTLTPMMCSRILKPTHGEGAEANRLADWLDRQFENLRQTYKRSLHSMLETHHVVGAFGLIVLLSCFFLYRAAPAELVPPEDSGFFGIFLESDNWSTQEYLERYVHEVHREVQSEGDVANMFSMTSFFGTGPNAGFIGVMLKPWGERDSIPQIVGRLTEKVTKVTGVRTSVFPPPPLPAPGRGYPVEFILKSTLPSQQMAELGETIIKRALDTGKFIFIVPEIRINLPQAFIEIDRDKAAQLGIDMAQIGTDLSAALAGGEVNKFSFQSRSYKVIQQVTRDQRLNPSDLEGYYTRARDGTLVPISTLVKISEQTMPRSRIHAQQLNANPLLAVPRPGVTQGEALEELEKIAKQVLPPGVFTDYSGASRQFKQEGSAMLFTFGFSLLIIYLVLAAQFESFRDPLIMLVSVPMSICGALLCLVIFGMTNNAQLTHFPGMTLNIYTQVGLVTLIGVISKHGILIVEFANKLQVTKGLGKREAIEEAASIRLRPVLMTTAALVVAMFPLLLSEGAGAAARFCMGMVITSGMTIGTIFTLLVVPTMYLYLGRDYAKQPAVKASQSPLPRAGEIEGPKDPRPA